MADHNIESQIHIENGLRELIAIHTDVFEHPISTFQVPKNGDAFLQACNASCTQFGTFLTKARFNIYAKASIQLNHVKVCNHDTQNLTYACAIKKDTLETKEFEHAYQKALSQLSKTKDISCSFWSKSCNAQRKTLTSNLLSDLEKTKKKFPLIDQEMQDFEYEFEKAIKRPIAYRSSALIPPQPIFTNINPLAQVIKTLSNEPAYVCRTPYMSNMTMTMTMNDPKRAFILPTELEGMEVPPKKPVIYTASLSDIPQCIVYQGNQVTPMHDCTEIQSVIDMQKSAANAWRKQGCAFQATKDAIENIENYKEMGEINQGTIEKYYVPAYFAGKTNDISTIAQLSKPKYIEKPKQTDVIRRTKGQVIPEIPSPSSTKTPLQVPQQTFANQ